MAHCWHIENTLWRCQESPLWRLHSFIDVSVEVRAGWQDTPAGIPGPGWLPLYMFWQQTQLHSHQNPLTTVRQRWGLGVLVRTVNLLHMEETIFPCKTCGFSCGLPVRMKIILSVCSILLSLLFPFCPSRAEEQRRKQPLMFREF